MISLIDGTYCDSIDSFAIIDCRYPFEYSGGHIAGAENISCPNVLEKRFFSNPTKNPKNVVIFHCEYSLQRAPRMYFSLMIKRALHFRSTDRQLNEYPSLFYPEMYILQGGYKNFYTKYAHRCDPQDYVSMNSADYREELKNVGKRSFRKCFSEGFLSRE